MPQQRPVSLPPGFTEHDVTVEAVRIVVRRIRATQLMMGLLPLVFAGFLWDHNPRIGLWLLLHLALKLAEFVELRWSITEDRIRSEPLVIANQLVVSQTLHAVAWALLLWVIIPGEDFEYVGVLAALTAIGSASSTAFAPVMRIATCHIAATTLTIIATWPLTGSNIVSIIPSLMVVYAVAIWARALQDSREARRNIVLEFSNIAYQRELATEAGRSLELSKQAEAANLAKSRFLAAASHDLRQPIHALGLFLGAMEQDARTSRQKATLVNAQAAARSSAEMLDALLDFSRAEAGVIVARPQDFAVQPLLAELEAEFAPLAEAKGLVFRTRETSAVVHSDPALVRLVLHNLVGNAVRYTNAGGILIGCRLRREGWTIEVWDTGIGIAPDQREAIFEDFRQLGNPERDRRKGLGLGLAISRRLADLLDTSLTVSSRLRRGSVFRLALPTAAGQAGCDAPESEQEGELPQPRCPVLIVDDDEAIRTAMVDLLAGWNFPCDAAETREEALTLAAARPPGLLICDWRLRNGEQGTEVIARLRLLAGTQVPAILVTGDTSPERLQEAAQLNLPVLHKPVAPGRLREAIARALA